MDGPKLISIFEVAERMGVTKRSVQYYIEKGQLRAVKVRLGKRGPPVWHCTEDDIKAFHDRREAQKRIIKRAEEFGKDLL